MRFRTALISALWIGVTCLALFAAWEGIGLVAGRPPSLSFLVPGGSTVAVRATASSHQQPDHSGTSARGDGSATGGKASGSQTVLVGQKTTPGVHSTNGTTPSLPPSSTVGTLTPSTTSPPPPSRTPTDPTTLSNGLTPPSRTPARAAKQKIGPLLGPPGVATTPAVSVAPTEPSVPPLSSSTASATVTAGPITASINLRLPSL